MFSTIKIWELIVLAAVIVALWVAGDYHGHSVENAKWEALQAKAEHAAHQKELAMQAAIDSGAAKYEKDRTDGDVKLADAQKELQDAIAKNSDYGKCHVDAGFMHAYSSLTGSSKIITESGK